MLKYLSKMAMDMLPSVAATIIGAYVVNHYIVARPAAETPAAAVSSASPKKAVVKADAKPAAAAAEAGNLPGPGVTAKGISEKAILEKTAAERPAVVEKPAVAEQAAEKPMETASIPVETRRHPPLQREKAMAKSAPAVAAPNTVLSAEAAAPADEHHDANDLARAAIERLRGAGDASPRTQEAARVPEGPRVASSAPIVSAPVVAPLPVRPLPPPIMVSTPPVETFEQPPGSRGAPDSPAAMASDDPRRPIPPADIPLAAPSAPPLDLRADAGDPPRREHTTVAEDMLLAAKSVFHAVLPK